MTKTKFGFIFIALLAMFLFTAESVMVPSFCTAQDEYDDEYSDEEYDEDAEDAEEDEDGAGARGSDEDPDAENEEGYSDEDEDFDPDAPLPEPKRVSGTKLETKDHVLLSATYYPGNRGKKSVPVILLHDWTGNREDVEVLAQELQRIGCAVLIPDLRGHGRSNRMLVSPEKTRTFEAGAKIKFDDLKEIVQYDLPCLKRFLMQQNNAGRLNIDKLCVGGVGYGGMAAAYFANQDWNPMVRRKKANPSAGDVKGFFIVSPPKNVKGIRFIDTLTYPNWRESASCIVIGNTKGKKLVKAMETQVKKACGKDAMERCWFRSYDVDGTGADMIQDPDSDAVLDITAFVELRCIKRDILWKSR